MDFMAALLFMDFMPFMAFMPPAFIAFIVFFMAAIGLADRWVWRDFGQSRANEQCDVN